MQTLTAYQSQYYAWLLTRQCTRDNVEALASTLVDAQVDLNPHQVEAALFACRNPLSRGVILADEVGLGKTIEAGLVILQRWAERRRRILIIVPANLRKQWHQELQDKFGLSCILLESKNYTQLLKQGLSNPFANQNNPIICSYQFAKSKARDIKAVAWDLVVLDEAHRLRNVYKPNNVIARTLKDALSQVHSKVLLTATPLQNSLQELYGLVSLIDEHIFGNLDSFRNQFAQAKGATLKELRQRLSTVCKRTLRKQVQPYVAYTARRALVQEFTPSAQEQQLSQLVADYLRRPHLKALPEGQRQLISLVLWKLLASSTHAIAGALDTMATRLEALLQSQQPQLDLVLALDQDYEALDETADEWEDTTPATATPFSAEEASVIAQEMAELRQFKVLASGIRQNAKGQALLVALERAFAELERLGAAKKAIIFTESKRTQTYLMELLSNTAYGKGIVLFNGSNSDASAQRIYKDWLKRHANSDRISDSKTADTRAALVEYFQEQGTLMIATEAGAEGINLQFCSLVINYDLPWNPQRVEQRIGRCHRYGQRFDVVVVNFVDRSNEADARVYELLAEKFQLFEGVFGASDEILGAIGSGVDLERRIADIYRSCRDSDTIQARFSELRAELSAEIKQEMLKTRHTLLENFDEEVHEKLRLCRRDSHEVRSRFERMLFDLSQYELANYARFTADGFVLTQLPEALAGTVALGKYVLPRSEQEAHIYRLSHPLAQWVTQQAMARQLPYAHVVFDYQAYGMPLTTLQPYRGQQGWLVLKLITVRSLEHQEQHLIVAACTHRGEVLQENDPEKLLRCPAQVLARPMSVTIPVWLTEDLTHRTEVLLQAVEQQHMNYLNQESQKLDAWSEDLKFGLEQAIKQLDGAIKQARTAMLAAVNLADRVAAQQLKRDLESKRSQLRKQLFEDQDQIDQQQELLLQQLQARLATQADEQVLFVIEWSLG